MNTIQYNSVKCSGRQINIQFNLTEYRINNVGLEFSKKYNVIYNSIFYNKEYYEKKYNKINLKLF